MAIHVVPYRNRHCAKLHADQFSKQSSALRSKWARQTVETAENSETCWCVMIDLNRFLRYHPPGHNTHSHHLHPELPIVSHHPRCTDRRHREDCFPQTAQGPHRGWRGHHSTQNTVRRYGASSQGGAHRQTAVER